MGDLGSIPELGRSHGGGQGNPLLLYSCLETPHGQRSLAGYNPWGRKESDMIERLSTLINLTFWLHWVLVAAHELFFAAHGLPISRG